MFDLLIVWIGIVSTVGVLSCSVLNLAKLYYENKRQERLDRFDRGLQLEEVKQATLIDEIVESALNESYPYQIGEKVLDKLVANKLITKSRASYVRIGAADHRR